MMKLSISAAALVYSLFAIDAFAATEITSHDITWTLDGTQTCGTYANGDPWCVDPGSGIDITMISPMSTNTSGRIRHGSMINPSSSGETPRVQGYDSHFGRSSANITYAAADNVGRPSGNDISSSNVLTVTAGESLVSTLTVEEEHPATDGSILDASVLTIVSSAPSAGAFRPPYSGTDKTHYWNTSDIQWSRVPSISSTGLTTVPDLATLKAGLERLWLDHAGGTFIGREFHPFDNMPGYGADMSIAIGEAALSLALDYSQAEKEDLAIYLIQIGIDVYGVTSNYSCLTDCGTMGGLWFGGGGQGIGRRMSLMLAGRLLDSSTILAYGDSDNYPIWQSDQQFFVVQQSDVDLDRYTGDGRERDEYTSGMIGMAEWGEQHDNQPNRDGSNLDVLYRSTVGGGFRGEVLASILFGVSDTWGQPEMIDYYDDRWTVAVELSESLNDTYMSAFAQEMWNDFRDYTPEDTTTEIFSDGASIITGD